ncbi:MAG: nodulation protein NfeD [Porticoccaceae bacterium]|nr:nodulation protein NfeD [Porticoccaceae bacterium]
MLRLLATLLAFTAIQLSQPLTAGTVSLVDIDGAIGPAQADYVVRAIDTAHDRGDDAIVVRIDTPGGLDGSMREIIQRILASEIPVIGYVAPQGARAASAGTYILYASHIAAMAPATNLGAATPVQIGGMPTLPTSDPKKEQEKEPQKTGAQDSPTSNAGSAMENKLINDARAYISGLAELRGRNQQWAEKAVTEGATLTASQALKENVINLVAEDVPALLQGISGSTVTTSTGQKTLNTANASVAVIAPDWRTRFLGIITNPSVAYILLMVGIYGLVLEFSNPGIGAGGVVGGISLFLALYALQMLPISYSALGLILLGLGLMTAEALSPSFGILGFGGIVAFLFGSIMLMDTDVPGFQIALPVILALTAASAGLLIFVLGLLFKTRRQPVVSGLGTFVGETATVVSARENGAMVKIHGELWQVHCNQPLAAGDRVRITQATGLVLEACKEETPQ